MSVTTAVYSRRTFFKLTFSTLFVASSGCSFSEPAWEEIAQRLITTLNHPERARLIGSLYLDGTPDTQGLSFEQRVSKLLRTLELEPGQITEETIDSVHDRIRQRVRRDFIDENIVIVKGYMFSKTEIMLCSLAASLPPA